MEMIQKSLPLMAALLVVAALTYVGGFMHYPGIVWIGMFDVGDIISLSWPIASGATVFMLGGLALGFTSRLQERASEASPPATVRSKPISRWWLIWLFVIPLLGSRIVMRLPVEFGVFAISTPIVAMVFYEVFRRRLDQVQNYAVLAVLTLSFCYCAGIAMGSLPFSESKTTLARLSDGSELCGRLITPLRRGALISVSRSSVIFLEWSRIESLRTDARCAMTNA